MISYEWEAIGGGGGGGNAVAPVFLPVLFFLSLLAGK